MKRILGLVRVIAILGLVTGFVAADLTAALATDWPLPIRRNIQINRLNDLRGVLIRWDTGAVFQIEEAVWEISPSGNLGYSRFKGYNQSGDLIEFQKMQSDGLQVLSPDDLYGFRLGDPSRPETQVQVDWIVFGTDGDGYLIILEEEGIYPATGEYFSHASSGSDPCGMNTTSGCRATTCTGPCGAQPGCACTSGIGGACENYTNQDCDGSCPSNYQCFNKQGSCGCWPLIDPPGGGSSGSGSGDVLQKKEKQVEAEANE